MTNDFRLVMSHGPQPGQTFILDKDVMTLGRDPGNAIVVNDPQASRQHARITRQGNLMTLKDLGSTNGTFANGVRLTNPHTLSNGDVIGLGDSVRLTYYGAGADAMMAPTEILGEPTAPLQPSYTPPPQPAPPPAYAPSPPPPPTYAAPPAQEKKGKSWLGMGCGCLVLLIIVACVGVFALDHFEMLPDIFYRPLFWLGLDKFFIP